MSEHDIEDLVEASIRALDASSRSTLDIRDGIARLFRYQAGHDSSFTHFRLMEILLRREHTLVVPESAHLLHAAATGGYFHQGTLYCDVDTPLWRALSEHGTIPAGPAVRALRLAEVVAWVVEGAHDQPDLVLRWYKQGAAALFVDAFTKPVEPGEVVGINPFTGQPIYATAEMARPRAFTLDELRAQPAAILIRDAGLAARARVAPGFGADDEGDTGESAALTEETMLMRTRWMERAAELKRRYPEVERVKAWWDGTG
ncbi:MAG TPA: hypothetical protein VM513_26065 [Kofleriaceae bacterium]|nr:hypothetical protein [Kofleriaceae bacterium]